MPGPERTSFLDSCFVKPKLEIKGKEGKNNSKIKNRTNTSITKTQEKMMKFKSFKEYLV